MKDLRRSLRWFAVATLLLYVAVTALFVAGWLSNRHRLDEIHRAQVAIQASRVSSCRANYLAFRQVFRPFFPRGRPKTWPQKARHDLEQLLSVTERLANRCSEQTRPGGHQ